MAPSIRRVDFGPQFPAAVTRVAAYARVSTGKDAMLHSLSAQVSYYSNMIQKHPGWLYCGVYADEGITGTKEDRENFCRMMADCRAGKLDLIITKGISRLSRNTVTLLETVRELKELGVDVFFEEQNIHTLSAAGELMLTILASFAQEESRSASDNQKWRVQKAFENGELMNWRFMLGYRIKDGEVSVYEPEAAAVREVFRRFIHGATMGSLAKYLNESLGRGVLGGTWKTQHVHVLLTNEKFTGNALLQKTFRNNHIEKAKRPNNGELPRYYAEGTHPAIIEKSFAEMKNALDNGYKAAFFDAAALFESGAASRCDFTVCVTAPESVRFSRIIERDGLSPDEAERRMNAQKADDFYTGRSDFVIDNSPGRDLASQVGELVRLLKL